MLERKTVVQVWNCPKGRTVQHVQLLTTRVPFPLLPPDVSGIMGELGIPVVSMCFPLRGKTLDDHRWS